MRITSIRSSHIVAEFETYDCCLLCQALEEGRVKFFGIEQESQLAAIDAYAATFKAAAIAGEAQGHMIPQHLESLEEALCKMGLQCKSPDDCDTLEEE